MKWSIGVICLIAASLAFVAIFSGCSQEQAVERLMADPQMSKLILDRLWQTPETKETLVEMVMNDPESMNKLLQSVVEDTTKAKAMMDRLMANENLKVMLTEKTADLHKKKK